MRPLVAASRVWAAFWEMDVARKFQIGMGVAYMPIGHGGIAEYQLAHGVTLKPWERRAILEMDKPRLIHLNRSENGQGGEGRKPTVSDQPITSELLKALFNRQG